MYAERRTISDAILSPVKHRSNPHVTVRLTSSKLQKDEREYRMAISRMQLAIEKFRTKQIYVLTFPALRGMRRVTVASHATNWPIFKFKQMGEVAGRLCTLVN